MFLHQIRAAVETLQETASTARRSKKRYIDKAAADGETPDPVTLAAFETTAIAHEAAITELRALTPEDA